MDRENDLKQTGFLRKQFLHIYRRSLFCISSYYNNNILRFYVETLICLCYNVKDCL